MQDEKELNKAAESEEKQEVVEGYSYCDTQKSRCMNDCGGAGAASPFISSLN